MPAINAPRATAAKRAASSSGSGSLTSTQKSVALLAAVLVGPAALKKLYEKPPEDLSAFNIVTKYDTPAIEKRDGVLRIEFCASWQVNGQFRRCAQGLQQAFPSLKIEGGPYTPPASVQSTIRAVRAAQLGVAAFFFTGEQLFAKLGRPAPPILGQMHENKLLTAGAVYGLDVIAQTAKSINAFEITYNGQLLHSKLQTGQFPDATAIANRLREVMAEDATPPTAAEAS